MRLGPSRAPSAASSALPFATEGGDARPAADARAVTQIHHEREIGPIEGSFRQMGSLLFSRNDNRDATAAEEARGGRRGAAAILLALSLLPRPVA